MDTLTAKPPLLPTPRTTLKRRAERGSYDRTLVHAIIDEALYCHVGVEHEGRPYVLPTAHARIGEHIYLHGARANHLLRALANGHEAAVTFTLLDGLVLARTAFHHSMNYRSVALFGRATEVTELEHKRAALTALVEHVAKGRSLEARMPNDEELRTTLVLQLPIEEASAKVRSGPPRDTGVDLEHPCWAGELPLRLTAGPIARDPELPAGTLVGSSVSARARELGPPQLTPVEWQRDGLLVSTDHSRLDFERVHRFLSEQSYWARGVSAAKLLQAIEHSVCFGLYRGREQLGFARVTTDFARTALLADVFVLEPHRGQKLGSWLVQCILEHPELREVDRWLLGTADAHAFYARFGFQKDEQGRFMGRLRAAAAP
jgi:nitroimidazol reductase NimA-like FMN-containing flavoprotein (pyridoxamine 5'-phosphate oxidase superfamily)/GNAT superfamily N-acetyltransferase